MDKFIGRKEELKILSHVLSKKGYHGVLVYGRRRQGKSALIKEALKAYEGKLINYQCIDAVSAINLAGLVHAFKNSRRCSSPRMRPFRTC